MFKYVDLNELKIKETNEPFVTINHTIEIGDTNCSIKELKNIIEAGLNSIQPTKVGWRFHDQQFKRDRVVDMVFTIVAPQNRDEIEDEDFMETISNLLTTEFFYHICTDKGRQRERRLDAPDNLKELNVSIGALKEAINCLTATTCFNLEIKWQNYTYTLVNQEIEPCDN